MLSRLSFLRVSKSSYFNPVAINSCLKVRNCQIWQSGTETSEIRGKRRVTEFMKIVYLRPGSDMLHLCKQGNVTNSETARNCYFWVGLIRTAEEKFKEIETGLVKGYII